MKGLSMNVRKTMLALCIATGSLAAGTAPALADVYVRIAPPAPRYEAVPVLAPGWAWDPGYWNWTGHHYVWVKGHRVHARHGHHWQGNHWVEDHGRWQMHHGHWVRD